MQPIGKSPDGIRRFPDFRRRDIEPHHCERCDEAATPTIERGPKKTHFISKSRILAPVARQGDGMWGLQTEYVKKDGELVPSVFAFPAGTDNAGVFPGICEDDDKFYNVIDNVNNPDQSIDIETALEEACLRGAYYCCWLQRYFSFKLAPSKNYIAIEGLTQNVASQLRHKLGAIYTAAKEIIRPIPHVERNPSAEVAHEKHFVHFWMPLPSELPLLAVSKPVVLQLMGKFPFQTLAFVNVFHHRMPDTLKKAMIASLSLPRKSEFARILIASEFAWRSEAECQAAISYLATRTPDGIYFGNKHYSKAYFENKIFPDLKGDPFPGFHTPVIAFPPEGTTTLKTRFDLFSPTGT